MSLWYIFLALSYVHNPLVEPIQDLTGFFIGLYLKSIWAQQIIVCSLNLYYPVIVRVDLYDY